MQKSVKLRCFMMLALLAFLTSTVLPFFAVYKVPPHDAPAQSLSSMFGEKILLCTGEGFKWVKLADLLSGKEKPKPHGGLECPLCYVAVFAKALLAAFLAFSSRENPLGRAALLRATFARARKLVSLWQARAPPVSFAG